MTDYRPPSDYLPHAAPMVMLETVRLLEAGHAVCSVSVAGTGVLAPFLDPAGNLPAWFGLEIMAQTVGVSAAGRSPAGDAGSDTQGMLLGTQQFHAAVPAFAAGSELFCEAALQQSSGPLHSYECSIRDAHRTLARARVNIYQGGSLPAGQEAGPDGATP